MTQPLKSDKRGADDVRTIPDPLAEIYKEELRLAKVKHPEAFKK